MSETSQNQLRFEEILRCIEGGHLEAAKQIAFAAAAECAAAIEEFEARYEAESLAEAAYREQSTRNEEWVPF
jgi:hypothetical protein